jgi:hypothetical protein
MDQKKLEEIHDALTDALLKRVRDGAATAADLNVARAFLKDNGVEVSNPAHMGELAGAVTDALPFEAPDDSPKSKRKSA